MTSRKKKVVVAEDLYRFKVINGLRIAPDGKTAVYYQSRVDAKTEKKFSNLWMVDTERGEPRQFTYGDQNDNAPRWSPDGSQIAFLSNRENKDKPPQIYLIPFHGGEARRLTEIEGTISDFAWSPDGRRFVCSVQKTDLEDLEREKDEQKKKLGVVSRHYERVFFKLDGVGYLPKERLHIWTVDASTGKARQLTDHPIYDEQFPAWSPDGKWIAFTSNRSENPDFNPDEYDLFLLPAAGGEFHQVPAPLGEKTHPSVSPDGKWIAYYGMEGKELWYKNNSLWVVPVEGGGKAQNLTETYDLHISPVVINDVGEPEQMPPAWTNDSQRIYFPVSQHGSSTLMSVSVSGDLLQTEIGEGGVVGSFSFDRDQKRLAYIYGQANDPCQVMVQDLKSKTSKKLTRVNADVLRNVDLGELETVWIKGPHGNDLQGWILKPPGFDPNQKYPSILEIHGGPLTQYGFNFMHEFYFLASKGYVVHFSNPRGGRGYGEKHAGAIWGDWGNVDYADIMAWTDYIAERPYIDRSRMGVTGGSYGGYMTLWIIGHTDRFKAAVTQRCVSNMVSMWGSSDLNWSFQVELQSGPPFEDLQKIWDMSPMKYIGNARTPTLVIHNEGDLRCPIEQGEQAFVALKRIGVDTEMVRFPDEFHGLSRTGRTDRRVMRLNHILRWFEKYLKS
jgi:dipeptidyl aminopeptidase/acylaminoacyl peptidase